MAQITLNSSGVASNGTLALQSNGTTTAVTIDANQRAAFVAGTAALPAITTTGDTNTGIFFPAADTIAFSEGGAEAMRIDSSGNLLVGTTTANGKLAVYQSTSGDGTISVGNAQDVYTCNVGKQGSSAYGATSAGDAFLYTSTKNISIMADGGSSVIKFSAGGNTERARIDSSGNFMVGTTSSNNKLEVQQTNNSYNTTVFVHSGTSQAVSVFDATSAAYVSSVLGLNSNTAAGTGWKFMACYSGGFASERLFIRGDGNVYNINNTYGAISDIKLKENIVDATPKLAGLMQVKVRNYNIIGDTTKQIGVVAQELETVFPAMVDESIDSDKEGNDLGTTTKSVKYSVFVPMLIKAMQEQQAIIQTLTDRITALEQA